MLSDSRTAHIASESKKVGRKPQKVGRKLQKVGEKPQKSREKTAKSRKKIVALLAQDGKLSAAALAKQIGLSAKTIEKHLAKLKADGIIERIGPAKGGYWKVKQHSLTLS